MLTLQGELVYANYGEEKDFKLLLTKGVSCHDKIVIMRYGRIFPGRMVIIVEFECDQQFCIIEKCCYVYEIYLVSLLLILSCRLL